MTDEAASRDRVADVMVTCPKTLTPLAGVDDLRALFSDDHVHMALVVDSDGRLVTTIERADIPEAPNSTPVTEFGALLGRTVQPSYPLDAATTRMIHEARRRLAVVDDAGRLLGLLCLKRDGSGFCTNEGIHARADERERAHSLPSMA
ncbi:CBS domain-containing protein [Streptomyces sp. DSM 40750]|uniref:CBS domain-containing protein n=1 Tax=Streptomyces sp. DSM 40750 TaxID=2801030 RepID=UPI00214C5351|nr:CBS domain-containing protein [Streptomyces sp. DSM 40750]UUU19612.1 CBS domain-containing protein [Streptomyces sp. DSM 40750]UUU27046.1 CBS domain-containing protein [Streptomyces sp. DSM 40750]